MVILLEEMAPRTASAWTAGSQGKDVDRVARDLVPSRIRYFPKPGRIVKRAKKKEGFSELRESS